MKKKILLSSKLNFFFYIDRFNYITQIYIINNIFLKLSCFFNFKNNINIIFVDKNYMLYINNKFRFISKPTNVLSFVYNNLLIDFKINNDIFICNNLILHDSLVNNLDYLFYFIYIIIHSFLHLLSFNHENLLDKRKMIFWENFFVYFFNY